MSSKRTFRRFVGLSGVAVGEELSISSCKSFLRASTEAGLRIDFTGVALRGKWPGKALACGVNGRIKMAMA